MGLAWLALGHSSCFHRLKGQNPHFFLGRHVGVDESFANFFSNFDMLSFYPFREISCEIRYAVHFSPAEISNLAHLGVTGTLYGSEAEAKNEI